MNYVILRYLILSAVLTTLLLVPMTRVAASPVTPDGNRIDPSMFLDGLENLDDPNLGVSPKQYQKWLKAYIKEYFR